MIVVFWARTAEDSYRGLKTSGTLHDCNEETNFLLGQQYVHPCKWKNHIHVTENTFVSIINNSLPIPPASSFMEVDFLSYTK